MKRALCTMMFAAMLLPGYAQQPHSLETSGGAAPQNSDSSIPAMASPSPTNALFSPGTTNPVPPRSADETVAVSSALQTQIQDALSKGPVFNRNGVKVTESKEGIELSGEVTSGRDRLNAGRIAQSYARGKKVVNHIVVKGHSAPPGANLPEAAPLNRGNSTGSPNSGGNNPP